MRAALFLGRERGREREEEAARWENAPSDSTRCSNNDAYFTLKRYQAYKQARELTKELGFRVSVLMKNKLAMRTTFPPLSVTICTTNVGSICLSESAEFK